MIHLFILVLLPAVLFAGDAKQNIEELIANAWLPDTVRVEWAFDKRVTNFEAYECATEILEPKPLKLSGSMKLNLLITSHSGDSVVNASGNARIFVKSLVVNEFVPMGTNLSPNNFLIAETEWSRQSEMPLSCLESDQDWIAAHGLTAGRALRKSDLRPIPIVRRGDEVNVNFENDNVKVSVSGRAMEDGGKGETISVKLSGADERCVDAIVAGPKSLLGSL